MRVVGQRKQRQLALHASANLLKQGALFNDEMHKLPTGQYTAIPRGVYCFATHEQANAHWLECLVKVMANYAR